jgi:hypothetical protein
MPLSFSTEEIDLLLELTRPIELRQRDQFLREVTAALEAAAERTGAGPGPGGLHRIGGAIQRRYRGSPVLGEEET